MNTNEQRAAARSRASRRLMNLTIGAAFVGVAATGTLGWVAAATSHASSPTIGQTATVFTSPSNRTTGTAPTVSNGSGRAHVSTGGS
jgi:predicted GNAT family acetyltransferase